MPARWFAMFTGLLKIVTYNWYTKVGKCNPDIRIIPARAANIEVVPVKLTIG